LSFEIKAGQKVAIMGDGDSGKTVLLRMLTGAFQDFEGSLTFNQIPISNYNLNSLRSKIGIYLQKQDIFDATLWENLTLGNPNIKEQEAIKLFGLLDLNDFFSSLPKGFDTELEPTGKRLSSSTVQKLLIARALLNSPTMLLLDEPLKLFAEDQKQVLQDYLFGLEEVTMLFTTNDESIAKKCDIVIALVHGQIKSITYPRS
jgi:ABC-type bacteriocin/lantibiotic exporter with double-glycine peptidase domain